LTYRYLYEKKGGAGQSVKLRIGQIVRMGSDNLSEGIEKPPDDIRKFLKTYNSSKRQKQAIRYPRSQDIRKNMNS
jgi:hypothetical protein